jgi:hypothetical protein
MACGNSDPQRDDVRIIVERIAGLQADRVYSAPPTDQKIAGGTRLSDT